MKAPAVRQGFIGPAAASLARVYRRRGELKLSMNLGACPQARYRRGAGVVCAAAATGRPGPISWLRDTVQA